MRGAVFPFLSRRSGAGSPWRRAWLRDRSCARAAADVAMEAAGDVILGEMVAEEPINPSTFRVEK